MVLVSPVCLHCMVFAKPYDVEGKGQLEKSGHYGTGAWILAMDMKRVLLC